jgi:uncharacterized membrane protein YhaH (DUF805 family)
MEQTSSTHAEASPGPTSQRQLTLDELCAIALGNGPDTMPLSQLYFRVTGRIPRRTFWLHGVLSLLLVAVLGNALLDIAGFASDLNGKLVNLLLAWPCIAVSAKRLHDFNRSAWWMLVNLVPGIGSFVMLVANGCVRGTHGANRFGPDPLDPAAQRA